MNYSKNISLTEKPWECTAFQVRKEHVKELVETYGTLAATPGDLDYGREGFRVLRAIRTLEKFLVDKHVVPCFKVVLGD